MWNEKRKRRIEKLLEVIILFLIVPAATAIFGAEADKKSEEELKAKPDFVLTIKDDLISLSAKDASLKGIVEEIGDKMKIEVVANILEGEKITIEFDKLSVEDTIKRLREYADIVYVKDSEKEEGKVTKILVFPKGKGEELSKPEIKEEKAKEQGEELAKPGIGISVGEEAVREESPQTEPKESVKEKPTRPEPFKFEFDPSEFMGEENP